jgi:hypothetical protein
MKMKVTSGLLHTLVDRAACLAGTLDNRVAGRADIFTDSTGRRSNKDARGTQAIADRLAARRGGRSDPSSDESGRPRRS